MIRNRIENKMKKKVIRYILLLIKPFMPLIIGVILIIWIGCYIADIFVIGAKNDDKSDFKNEMKYYTTEDYSEDDKKGFFEGIEQFLSGIFKKVIDSEWPVPGHTYISSHFGKRVSPTSGASSMHSGIDIPAPEGTEIISIMDGKVTSTAWGGAGGYTITIESLDGIYKFSYCHSDPNYIVRVGQKVEKGQVIGKVGQKYTEGPSNNPYKDSTGKSTNGATTGCHCHFTLRKDGNLIDPEEFLNEARNKEGEMI